MVFPIVYTPRGRDPEQEYGIREMSGTVLKDATKFSLSATSRRIFSIQRCTFRCGKLYMCACGFTNQDTPEKFRCLWSLSTRHYASMRPDDDCPDRALPTLDSNGRTNPRVPGSCPVSRNHLGCTKSNPNLLSCGIASRSRLLISPLIASNKVGLLHPHHGERQHHHITLGKHPYISIRR